MDIDIDSASDHSSIDEDEEYLLAQREWEESLAQLQQVVAVVLLPFVGKWLGRKWSYLAFDRYQRLGFTKAFFLGS
ncbi:hypothetical protein DL96DRAFT_1702272 [Flagelloscypha sp. PMI_526]|nr:hypothetical protein DL96DRAFT_1702272 [Flagelloscypha sp. PMI_526]